MARERRGIWGALGPGLLFAAAAVGVSHLVQSTRAGAMYGMALVPVVLLANAAKYPAFRFGPHYAAATGTSLLEGYRRQGVWALLLYALLTLATMFTVQAAVTVVTAALAIAMLKTYFGVAIGPIAMSAVLLVVCGALLAVGRYHWLDRVVKVLVAVLTVSTLVATGLALAELSPSVRVWTLPASGVDADTIFFVAALVGWMPSAIDVAVWQSLWTLARKNDTGHTPTLRESMLDFHIGYWGTALLALCFLTMGAGVMHGSGRTFSPAAGAFAGQVIELYSSALGSWAAPIVGVAAFAVMFSTTLTVLDGFPRAIAVLFARFKGPEDPQRFELDQPEQRRVYWASMAVLLVGSLVVLLWLLTSLKTLVDVATTASFLTAPMLAMLNHRAITSPDVPESARPRGWLRMASLAGIAFLSLFALYYLYVRYLA